VPRPIGTDRLEAGFGGRLTLHCEYAKGWRPRTPEEARRAFHPGTAVSWEEAIYEVVEATPAAGGGMSYALEPWRRDLAIRSLERYDPASERARSRERRWRREAIRRRRLAVILSPLLGHLPGKVQERMEAEFGAPANAMTYASALPLFTIGLIGLFGAVARMAGGSLAPLPEPSLPLSAYLFGESGLRLFIVATQSRPAGSIPGALLWALWEGIRRVTRR
jgi:hypothetical protein